MLFSEGLKYYQLDCSAISAKSSLGEMVLESSVKIGEGFLAQQITELIMSTFCETAPISCINSLKNVKMTPLAEWKQIREGSYKLSYGLVSISRGLEGSALMMDPHAPAVPLTIKHIDGQYSTITMEGGYLAASGGVSMSSEYTTPAQFQVRSALISGCLMCTVKCREDGNYWHVSRFGCVCHHLRDGFKLNVFHATPC